MTLHGKAVCRDCGCEMEKLRDRTLSTGKGYSITLSDYGCKACGGVLREGAKPEHHIWLSGLFLQSRRKFT